MINGSRSDQLMFYENRGGHRTLVKDVEADSNQVLTVSLGEVSH